MAYRGIPLQYLSKYFQKMSFGIRGTHVPPRGHALTVTAQLVRVAACFSPEACDASVP